METKEAILKRRSIRLYQDRAISEEDLKEILDAGTYAPSAVNLQPWYFVAIQDKGEMEKLYQIMGDVSTKIEPELRERFARNPEVVSETTGFISKLGGAPVCILAFQLKPDYGKRPETIIQSVAAAVENMLLAATDKGIGSCWLTAPLEVDASEILRETFAPECGNLLAVITLGYPAQNPKTPMRKSGRYVIK